MAENAEVDLKTLRAEVNDLRANLSKINDTLVDIVRRRAGEAYEGFQESADKLKKTVAREIEQRPVTTAVTAFAFGLVLGLLFSRQSRTHRS